ncbi:MAG: ribonuclease G [Gammaproteobacteria bacterium]|nr:ribonuclease G [Gammaproteobacteria bacterium]
MSAEILINATPMETRVALIDQGLLQEIYIERRNRKGPVGNIYMGKVVRVMPGMQAAFVDIGLERAAFIHAQDITTLDKEGFEEHDDQQKDIQIGSLLREGQMLVVQVVKEPIASKGARLTTHLSIASRYLVHMPRDRHLGISQRIENEEERERLKSLIESCVEKSGLENATGFILRTAAEGVSEEEVLADIKFLQKLWSAVLKRMQGSDEIRPLYQDLVLYIRAMRDLFDPETQSIRVDDKKTFDEVLDFCTNFIPETVSRVEYYKGERPLFDLYSVDDEIQKALSKTVKLKSGGNLVIDQNEAMTTIDVNTGTFLGSRNQDETIFKTNLEAAKASARQMKVRNLGGIIILDFIDMVNEEHRRQVIRTLLKALEKDPVHTMVTELSDLGLVEMTRKRNRESLGQMLCHECPTCDGRGTVKTPETVCYEVFREILRVAKAYENDSILVMASQEVVDRLLDEDSAMVADMEELVSKNIRFQVEQMYHTEQFDVVLS